MSKKRQLDRLELIDLERLEYNKKHGTNYSYGMYTALVRLKKSDLSAARNGGSAETKPFCGRWQNGSY